MSEIEPMMSRVVTFDDDGTKREVVGDCQVCLRASEVYGCGVVSPTGVVHIGMDGGDTRCGKDATNDRWWWPI